MNYPTPKFKPLCTARVWLPKYVPSAIISLNHNDILLTKQIKDKKKILDACSKPCIHKTPVVVTLNNIPLVNKGQGEGFTRWKGWAWKWERIAWDIIKIN